MHRLAAVLPFCVLAAAVVCAQETLVSDNVTLGAAVAVEDPQAIAVEVTAEYGGTLVEPLRGRTFAMRLSDSRARVLARDPRVESMTVQAPGVPRVAEAMSWGTGVDYTYDGAGNVRKIGTDAFVYDAVSRLVQSDTNGVRRNYEYDGFGNRKKCTQSKDTPTEGDCQQAFTINSASNRVQGVSYDAAGNITVLGGHTYTYDALNVQTRDAWGALAREYIYTAGDERLAVYSVASASWQWTVRDASGKVLREFTSQDGANGKGTANWTWSKDYIWRDGLLLASRQMEGATAKTYHNHLDHLGTPRRITDSADRIVGIHDYFPFGTEASGGLNEPVLSLLKFTGHERDIVTSQSWDTLDYMHARFANPELGRFLSVDPTWASADLGTPQTWNRYTYARNNPLKYTDPDGRVAIADDILIGAFVGTMLLATYATAPSAVPGKSNGEIMAESAGRGLRSVGRWLLNGNTGGGGDQMAAETSVQNWSNHMAEKAEGTSGGDRAGKPFTPKGKKEIHDRNAGNNGGENRCDECDEKVVPGQKSQKGVTPPGNERQADHIIPKSKGGDGSPSNGRTLCRDCNIDKSDKLPPQ